MSPSPFADPLSPLRSSSGLTESDPYLNLQRGRRYLEAVLRQIDAEGEAFESTSRHLLEMFGFKKRGRWIMESIRHALSDVGLRVAPSLDAVGLDDPIRFDHLVPSAGRALAEEPSLAMQQAIPVESCADEPAESCQPLSLEVTPRVGTLPSARAGITSVGPQDRVDHVLALMSLNDYSQLPVMKGERDILGVVSWKSMGRSVVRQEAIAAADESTKYMTGQFEVCQTTDPLLDILPRVIANGFVFVRDERRRISGIITTTDLADFLRARYQAFALLAEIEALLRKALPQSLTKEELQQSRDPHDSGRVVDSVEDLTFGEYRRLLEQPEIWSRCNLRLERKVFLEKMAIVNRIRNDVMHFAVDETSEEDISELWNFLKGLRFIWLGRQVA